MVTPRELAAWDDGISSVVGDSDLEISCAAGFDRAAPGVLTFVKAETIADAPQDVAARIAGAAVVCKASLADELPQRGDVALLITEHPRLSFMKLVTQFFPPERPVVGVHETAVIDPGATIDPQASIGPYCVVGPRCAVGAASILHAGVVLQADVRIGRNVVIHASTVIGADGFGYERRPDGKLEKFPHLGGVVIEDEVEIGSNTSIDRGSLGDTILRRGCKIDNQVHIAHNVDVGEDAVIIAQAMIGGSVQIGARAWVAPAGIILNQVVIGEGALVGLGAVVTKDVAAGQTVLGSPAVPEDQFKANRAALKRLLEGGIA